MNTLSVGNNSHSGSKSQKESLSQIINGLDQTHIVNKTNNDTVPHRTSIMKQAERRISGWLILKLQPVENHNLNNFNFELLDSILSILFTINCYFPFCLKK